MQCTVQGTRLISLVVSCTLCSQCPHGPTVWCVCVQCNVQDIQLISLEPMYLSASQEEDDQAWDALRRYT